MNKANSPLLLPLHCSACVSLHSCQVSPKDNSTHQPNWKLISQNKIKKTGEKSQIRKAVRAICSTYKCKEVMYVCFKLPFIFLSQPFHRVYSRPPWGALKSLMFCKRTLMLPIRSFPKLIPTLLKLPFQPWYFLSLAQYRWWLSRQHILCSP